MKLRSIIFVIFFFFLIWGVKGVIDGHGFFGGILAQFVAAYLILELVAGAVIIYLVIKLIMYISNRISKIDKNDNNF